MPLKLDEKDVREIASRRYWARQSQKVIVYYSLLLALTVGLVVVLNKPWTAFALVPILVAIGWIIKWGLEEKKAKKELVKKWREDS